MTALEKVHALGQEMQDIMYALRAYVPMSIDDKVSYPEPLTEHQIYHRDSLYARREILEEQLKQAYREWNQELSKPSSK